MYTSYSGKLFTSPRRPDRVNPMNALYLKLQPLRSREGFFLWAIALLLSVCSLAGATSTDRHQTDFVSPQGNTPLVLQAFRPQALLPRPASYAHSGRGELAMNMHPTCNQPASKTPPTCIETALKEASARGCQRGRKGMEVVHRTGVADAAQPYSSCARSPPSIRTGLDFPARTAHIA